MYKKRILRVSFILATILVTGTAFGQTIKINFQPSTVLVKPAGYLPDYGLVFGDRGNGYSYGWDLDISGNMRVRGVGTDPYKTLAQMQEGAARTWEIALPIGVYNLFIACGDPSYNDQINTLDVEGVIVTDLNGRSYLDEYADVKVVVSDGRLTIKPAPGGQKCKIMFLHITRVAMFKAYGPVPADKAVNPDTSANLSWTPGDYTASHNVYFGDNFDQVNNGIGDTFKGNRTETSFDVNGLSPGTTYYWRIDEVNDLRPGGPWKGDVWSFSIPSQTAYNPYPPDGEDFVHPDVTLTWTPGLGAQSHFVYLDANFVDVNTATGGNPQTDPNHTPVVLAKDTVYYWRVDELDGVNTHRGNIWSFKTIPLVPKTDPNLFCWWKFDELLGNNVIDSSGYDRFGTVYGATLKTDGRVGAALYFGGDGDYVVDEDAEDYINGLGAITVCMWIKADQIGTDRGFINCVEPDSKDQMVTMRHDAAGGSYGGTNVFKLAVTSTLPEGQQYGQQLESASNIQTTGWQHVALVWRDADVIRFYVDGKENTPTGRTAEPNQAGGTITGCTKLIIGKGGKDQGTTAGWKGMIDDVRIYNIALTAQDIKQAMRGQSDLAWDPSPANGSTPDIKNALPLRWLSGENAAKHDVYFGTNRDAVANADTSDTTGIYRGRQSATSYSPLEGVQWGAGPYYWRIDEYNTDESISPGRLWQFTVADFIVVDDFEDYNDYKPDRIFDKWTDGWGTTTNGSTVGYADPDFDQGEHFAETIFVQSGLQSMPYFYDNNLKYSEATLPLVYPRDWTEQGVKVLTLWFRGYAPGLKEGPQGTYTMTALGADIWGMSDQFRFAYKQLSGPGSISAKVISVENTNEQAKAGVMIRQRLDVDSKFAAVYITPSSGCKFQGRLTPATDATSDTSIATPEQRAITAPYWVKIERDSSDNFNGYYSSDGIKWEPMAWNPQNIPMPADVYIGLALTSHNINEICKAQFSDVKTTGIVTPVTWTNAVIGTTMPSNAPERMYVAIANSTGTPAIVYNNDPNAAQIDTWTPWNIELKTFADKGVTLTNVNSISIGFGDKGNPKAGGSGKMYFDDIRLYRTAP